MRAHSRLLALCLALPGCALSAEGQGGEATRDASVHEDARPPARDAAVNPFTDASLADVAVPPASDGGCEAQANVCCTAADCAAHVLCAGSACVGCEAGWADCNHDLTDGCEADLSKDGNCGTCGASCCHAFCGCGFLGFGGQSCKPEAATFACHC